MEREKHSNEVFKQANQGAIDFSKMVYQSTFLLNGAAATALFSARNEEFYLSAAIYAFGAMSVIIGMALAHFYSLAIAKSWDVYNEDSNDIYLIFFKVKSENIEKWRMLPSMPVIISVVLFIWATILVMP